MIPIKMLSYFDHIEDYKELDALVEQKINNALNESGIHTMQIQHRVKTADSVAGKLDRKPEKYSSASDITDLVGFRIICYFTDQIDMISSLIRDMFVIDWNNCVDKSTTLSPNAFGYLSVHYICSLKHSDEYPSRLCRYKFEIQIRTVLQHTWAEIEHDLGYKNEFGVPLHVRREFSRMASLLEVADEGFLRIKHTLEVYSANVIDRLQKGEVADIALDTLSLREFMKYNSDYIKLIDEIAELTGANIIHANADPYLKQLSFLGIHDLGALVEAIRTHHDLAITLAKDSLSMMEIEEFSSFVGLYYICRAILIAGDYSEAELMKYFSMLTPKEIQAERNTARILRQRERYAKGS